MYRLETMATNKLDIVNVPQHTGAVGLGLLEPIDRVDDIDIVDVAQRSQHFEETALGLEVVLPRTVGLDRTEDDPQLQNVRRVEVLLIDQPLSVRRRSQRGWARC